MSDGPPDADSIGFSRRGALKAGATGIGAALFGGTGLTGHGVGTSQEYPPEYDIDVIREEAWVKTGTDTDDTGESDRAFVAIVRPASTDETDEQLPTVVRPDPYYTPIDESGWSPQFVPRDVGDARNSMAIPLYQPGEDSADTSVTASKATPTAVTPGGRSGLERARAIQEDLVEDFYFYEQELVPEGYAYVHVSPIGSYESTGCNTGGGPAEVRSVRAVVDWLNGRATAYGSKDGSEAVTADWTTGKTGMIGGSYRGALAEGVATTGVDGLETIVPIRALSSWYNYVRSNGAVVAPSQDGESVSFDLAQLSGAVTTRENGSVCQDTLGDLARTLDRDTGNYTEFWEARDYVTDVDNVAASVLLVHGLYDEIVRPRNFSRWLDGLKANDVPYRLWLHQGGHDEPKELDAEWWLDLLDRWLAYWLKGEDNGVMDEPRVVVERQDETRVEQADWPHPESEATTLRFAPSGEDTMGKITLTAPEEPVEESLVDNSEIPPAEFLGTENAAHRLVYRLPELVEPVHVSGTIRTRFELSVDSPPALVSCALVDYGPERPEIVNRGWMNPQNRESLEESVPLEADEPTTVEFPMQPVDYVFEEGHQLGFVVYSSDYNVTKRPPRSPELTLHLHGSAVDVPVVGGETIVSRTIQAAQESDGDETPAETPEETPTPVEETPDDSETPDDTPSDSDTPGDETPAESTDTAQDSTDGDGPGFGVASALAGLGGAGYLLKRRLRD